jgi:Protein of unknown function (DUF5818)
MYKTLMLVLVLVAFTAWVPAQTNSPKSGMASDQSMSEHKTVEGCLQDASGSYTLAAKDGTMYQLSGDTSKLAEHVGHEIQITGITSGSSSQSAATEGAAAQQQRPTLEVKSMKHIAKTCKSAMSQ